MAVKAQLCLLLFGTCLFSILLLLECRKLEGYAFPVFSTKECPGNQSDWKNRSSAINCTESNGYMCLPNENFTDLVEFCYIYPQILVQKDLCLYLVKRFSRVNPYNCRKFTNGCPESSYFSSETYIHPSCMEIENGCFSAEPSCKRQPLQSENSSGDTTLTIILGVSIPTCFICILVFYMIIRKYPISKRGSNTNRKDEELHHLLPRGESMDSYKESPNEKAIFDQWKEDDSYFISTKTCEEVEKLVKSGNLVIVTGHSGSGKSAIIQHIALKYKREGWIVKRITKAEDINDEHISSKQIIFVCNDPFGKESFDEILNYSWKTNEKKIAWSLKKVKLLISCRNYILSDTRVPRYLLHQSDIVDIDSEKYKLFDDEKRHILTRYTSDMNLSNNECDKIVKVRRYFPLLCKLYSSREYKIKDIIFFTEPVTALKEEILEFKKKDHGKYCALALLFLFNDDLCTHDLLENENKFKHTLKLCELPENTSLSAIEDNLNSLKDFMVRKVGDKYRFCHALVMEVTSNVFGTENPNETIEYADIRLLRKRVRLWDCEELTDPFTLFLSENYIEKLGERFLDELIGDRFMDVVLNPCMKEKRMIEILKKLIQKNPKKLQLLFEKKKHILKMPPMEHSKAEHLYLSKLALIDLEKDITPLFGLIVFGHTDFSLECLKSAQQMIANPIDSSFIYAVFCNGSMKLFHLISKDIVKKSLKNNLDNTLGGFQPIHIVSVYHNYEILEELKTIGIEINSKSNTWDKCTPLALAVGNDTEKCGDYNHEESGATRRDKTIQLLLNKGANINLCRKDGASPLQIACQNGHDSTVQLLLRNGADINLCTKEGASPLHIACQNGHDTLVQLLLNSGAYINLRDKEGFSPLFRACQYGHDITLQVLLKYEADIKLCRKDGASPLHIACQNGHYSTVQLLLSNGADINLCTKDGASPLYVALENKHDKTKELLLRCGADIGLCIKKKMSFLSS